MDSVPKRIHDFLVWDGRMYCDPCIQEHLGLRWHQQVPQITATLAVTNFFKRSVGQCCACSELTHVVQAVGKRTG
jgi:hypothetical protein